MPETEIKPQFLFPILGDLVDKLNYATSLPRDMDFKHRLIDAVAVETALLQKAASHAPTLPEEVFLNTLNLSAEVLGRE